MASSKGMLWRTARPPLHMHTNLPARLQPISAVAAPAAVAHAPLARAHNLKARTCGYWAHALCNENPTTSTSNLLTHLKQWATPLHPAALNSLSQKAVTPGTALRAWGLHHTV